MKRAGEASAVGMKRAIEAVEGGKASGGGKRAKRVPTHVHPERVRPLSEHSMKDGPVLYWMSREQRVQDNWALLYAHEMAEKNGRELRATMRQYGFMLHGLREVEEELVELKIPFVLLHGTPSSTVPWLASELGAGLVVCDMSPLRIAREWRAAIQTTLGSTPVHMVDAHNIVPVWHASPKLEYAARTIRSKIHHKLHTFLTPFPAVPSQTPTTHSFFSTSGSSSSSGGGGEGGEGVVGYDVGGSIDWDEVRGSLEVDETVAEVDWISPGSKAGLERLSAFIGSISGYSTRRNDPNAAGTSLLSPYFHYGHLAPQRAALEATAVRSSHRDDADAFLEELIIRRELSDNYCWYNPGYDSLDTLYPNFDNDSWAQKTLAAHAADPREYTYSLSQLERGETHDPLWNAAQLQMTKSGHMHGFLRMYWAKKILEWTPSPNEALEAALFLNDKYELDGRDPNGYVGCAWAIAGLHDQGWREREVFGKIRYMNLKGCKRKFDVDAFVAKWTSSASSSS